GSTCRNAGRLLGHCTFGAAARAERSTGNRMPTRIAMIPMTTSSSIKVNAQRRSMTETPSSPVRDPHIILAIDFNRYLSVACAIDTGTLAEILPSPEENRENAQKTCIYSRRTPGRHRDHRDP